MPEVCPDLDFDIPSITDDREETFSDSPLSLVKTLAVLLSWFSAYPGISKNAFSGLLYILHHFILPSPNNLPSSYKAAKSKIKAHLVSPVEYHCCKNDVFSFVINMNVL